MKKYFRRIPISQLRLVALGIALGFLARWMWPPQSAPLPRRSFDKPVVQPVEEVIDLPIIARPAQHD